MITEDLTISKGMEVFAADGEKVGEVKEIWADAVPRETATHTGAETAGHYFRVDHGGVLGIGATSMYVPFSAVCDAVSGDNLTIDCTCSECAEQYANKPAFLDGSDALPDEDIPSPLT